MHGYVHFFLLLVVFEKTVVQSLGSGIAQSGAPDLWLKDLRFKSWQEWRENLLLQGQLFVPTLISVSVPPWCYCSNMQ